MYKTNESVKERLRAVLSVAVIILLAAFCGVVLFIYVDISDGYIEKYALAIKSVGTGLLAVTASIAVVFSLKDKNFVPRLVLTVLVFAAIVLSALYALKISGFLREDDFHSASLFNTFLYILEYYTVFTQK